MTEEFRRTNPLARGDETVQPLEVYAEHAEIRKQIHDEIRKLHNTLNSAPQSVNIVIDRFLGCIIPLENLYDPGRLPVYTTIPRSIFPDKISCVWAIVSCLIQAYWTYELINAAEKIPVLILLERLEEINLNYPLMKIAGAENKGYYLELKL